jgi:hypothetical protein
MLSSKIKAYHDIVEHVPWQPLAFCDHGSSNERREYSAEAIEAMQEAQNLIGIGHVTNPYILVSLAPEKTASYAMWEPTSIPCCIREAVSKSSDHKNNHQNRVWGMHSNDNIGNDMASRREKRNTSLAELEMNSIVQQSRCSISCTTSASELQTSRSILTDKRRQEHQRDDHESKVVILLQLNTSSASAPPVSSIVSLHRESEHHKQRH